MRLVAPAKLNLYLHITGKRADGYHLLESLVVFTNLQDVLTIASADTLSLEVTGEFASDAGQADNLVLRAARLLQQETGTNHGARITLEKNIPVGAGLGGGSSDAATTLKGLNELWQLKVSDTKLREIGLKLGADVPMCLYGKKLIARGIGEVIKPYEGDLLAPYVVLVHPRIPLLTAQVYAMLDSIRGVGERNDLQRAAIAASPVVGEVLLAMETALPRPALVRMTGSGACCFALFDDADHAATYAAQLRAEHSTWWIRSSAIIR